MSTLTYDMGLLKNKKMLTKNEATFYMGVSIVTLTKIMNSGDFYPLVRIGHGRGRVFVNREKLDQWLDEQDGSRKYLK